MTPTVLSKVEKAKKMLHEELDIFWRKRTTGHLAMIVHTHGGCPQFVDFSPKDTPKDIRKL